MDVDRSNYTRVTSVLGAFSDFSFIQPEILARKCEIGTLTHKFIEMILKGEEFHVVPEEIEGYLASFKLFWEGSSHAWDLDSMELEKRLWCDRNKITGQVDCIIKGGGKTYLIDWKTSASYQKSFLLQGAAYQYLADVNDYNNTDPTMFVRLKKDGGKPTLHKSENFLEDLDMFFKCLEVYRFFGMEKRK